MTMKKLTSDGVDANTYPLLLLLDECANFGKIDSLQRTITAARGYKIQVMMIFPISLKILIGYMEEKIQLLITVQLRYS